MEGDIKVLEERLFGEAVETSTNTSAIKKDGVKGTKVIHMFEITSISPLKGQWKIEVPELYKGLQKVLSEMKKL